MKDVNTQACEQINSHIQKMLPATHKFGPHSQVLLRRLITNHWNQKKVQQIVTSIKEKFGANTVILQNGKLEFLRKEEPSDNSFSKSPSIYGEK
jgi:hypothetical protein